MIRYVKNKKDLLALCDTLTDRDAIPQSDRYEGMLAYILSEQKTYRLKGGTDNSYWELDSGPPMVIVRTETSGTVNLFADSIYGQVYVFTSNLTGNMNIILPDCSHFPANQIRFYFVGLSGYEADLFTSSMVFIGTITLDVSSYYIKTAPARYPQWIIGGYDQFLSSAQSDNVEYRNLFQSFQGTNKSSASTFNQSVGFHARRESGITINANESDFMIECTNGSSTTVNLPNPTTCNGRVHMIKRMLGSVTVQCAGYQIDNATTFLLNGAIYETVAFQSDGLRWIIIGRYLPISAPANSVIYVNSIGAMTGATGFEYNSATQTFSTQKAVIGSTIAIDASAILQCESSSQGFLLPRMTTAQRDAIATPAESLMIYNTTTKRPNFFDGTSWLSL